jgi:hypothetical protein
MAVASAGPAALAAALRDEATRMAAAARTADLGRE